MEVKELSKALANTTCFVQAMMQNLIEANPPVIHILKTKKKKKVQKSKSGTFDTPSRTTTPHTNTRKNLTANCTQKSISIHHPQANKLVSPEHNRYHIPPPPSHGSNRNLRFFSSFFCLSRVRWGSTRLPIPYHTYTADRFSKKKRKKKRKKHTTTPKRPACSSPIFFFFFFSAFSGFLEASVEEEVGGRKEKKRNAQSM